MSALVRRAFRERVLLRFLLPITLIVPSTGLAAQEAQLPPLPVVREDAYSEVLRSMYLYYHWLPAWNLSERFGDFCNADLGHSCFEGDWESYCLAIYCHTRKRKADFVKNLAEMARRYPDSPTAVGQAIYAAVRLEHFQDASDLVEVCAPLDLWWCHLARGYVLHRTHRSSEAEEHLRRGLEGAPANLRCRLEDIGFLLPEEAREEYEAVPCADRDAIHRHVWWLADPFFIEAGNDRWAEHVVRRFELLFHEQRHQAVRFGGPSDFPHALAHERDVVRRGPWDSWDPDQARGARRREYPDLIGWTSRKSAANHFLPDRLSLLGMTDSLAWRLAAEVEDEGYTRWEGPVVSAPVQVARFREGDSLIVALASDLGAIGLAPHGEGWFPDLSEPPGEGGTVGQAFIVTSERPGQAAALEPVPVRERLVFAPTVPNRIQLVGLEAFTPGLSARHRQVLAPLERAEATISDMLLYRGFGFDLPETRNQAIGLMHGSLRVPRDLDLGIYWEVYGIPADEVARISVTLTQDQGGWLARLARAMRVVGKVQDRTISWIEETGDARPFTGTFNLDLDEAETGERILTVRMELEDGRVLSTSRQLEIVNPGTRPAPDGPPP